MSEVFATIAIYCTNRKGGGCDGECGARGEEKVEALRAVLRSGLLKGLITDEAARRCLVDGLPHGEDFA